MRSGVIAQKVGMMRVFTDAGEHVPATVLQLGNCQVIAHRTKDRDGYVALQLGSGTRKVRNVSKAERGHFAVAKVEPKRKLAEFRVEESELIPVGAEITADHFVVGQFVDVTGTSIGKGFAGPMKRWKCTGEPCAGMVKIAKRYTGGPLRSVPNDLPLCTQARCLKTLRSSCEFRFRCAARPDRHTRGTVGTERQRRSPVSP